MAGKLTKAVRRDLIWFSTREYAALFGGGDPTLTMVRRLCKGGFVERVGRDPGALGFTRYAITEAGLAVLKDQKEGE